jgi:hypothetical protein
MGGPIVILGIVLVVFWSFWIGLVVTLIGLIPSAGSREVSGTEFSGVLGNAEGPGGEPNA